MVNINDLTANNDDSNLDQELDRDLDHPEQKEDRPQVIYKEWPTKNNTPPKKRSCHSWIKNLWLFAVLILLILSLLDISGILSLAWNGTALGVWYIFISLLLIFFLFFSRWIIGRIFICLLFLLVIGWLTGIGVYHGFVHTPNTDTTVLSYDFSSGTDNATILLDAFVSHSYVETNNATGIVVSYDWERVFHDISQDDDTIVLEEEKTWSILDAIDSSTHFLLWSDVSYTVSILGVIHRGLVNLTDVSRDTISLQGLWNDVRIVLDENTGNSITINGRYAGAHIVVPENVWINLYYDKVVWSLATQDFLMINKREYQSNNYAEADTKVDIFVDSIIGKVRIEYN